MIHKAENECAIWAKLQPSHYHRQWPAQTMTDLEPPPYNSIGRFTMQRLYAMLYRAPVQNYYRTIRAGRCASLIVDSEQEFLSDFNRWMVGRLTTITVFNKTIGKTSPLWDLRHHTDSPRLPVSKSVDRGWSNSSCWLRNAPRRRALSGRAWRVENGFIIISRCWSNRRASRRDRERERERDIVRKLQLNVRRPFYQSLIWTRRVQVFSCRTITHDHNVGVWNEWAWNRASARECCS